MARHLLETANDLLQSGEKEVAVGLLRRALSLEARESDEIKLRLASVRRDELVEEISRCIHSRAFDEARIKIARLRTIHPIFEPVANRLESEVRATKAGVLLDQVVSLCAADPQRKERILEARRLFREAQSLHQDPGLLHPVEGALREVEVRLGIEAPAAGGTAAEKKPDGDRAAGPRSSPTGFAIDPVDTPPGTEKG
jgi:hypothetical protein